jgi:hypothetical protein
MKNAKGLIAKEKIAALCLQLQHAQSQQQQDNAGDPVDAAGAAGQPGQHLTAAIRRKASCRFCRRG